MNGFNCKLGLTLVNLKTCKKRLPSRKHTEIGQEVKTDSRMEGRLCNEEVLEIIELESNLRE